MSSRTLAPLVPIDVNGIEWGTITCPRAELKGRVIELEIRIMPAKPNYIYAIQEALKAPVSLVKDSNIRIEGDNSECEVIRFTIVRKVGGDDSAIMKDIALRIAAWLTDDSDVQKARTLWQ